MLGGFDTEDNTISDWLLFIIATFLMPLVMLNMLIAIMSDTYSRVMSELVPSDYMELNEMILEQE